MAVVTTMTDPEPKLLRIYVAARLFYNAESVLYETE